MDAVLKTKTGMHEQQHVSYAACVACSNSYLQKSQRMTELQAELPHASIANFELCLFMSLRGNITHNFLTKLFLALRFTSWAGQHARNGSG
jgi:hypothetical protein